MNPTRRLKKKRFLDTIVVSNRMFRDIKPTSSNNNSCELHETNKTRRRSKIVKKPWKRRETYTGDEKEKEKKKEGKSKKKWGNKLCPEASRSLPTETRRTKGTRRKSLMWGYLMCTFNNDQGMDFTGILWLEIRAGNAPYF